MNQAPIVCLDAGHYGSYNRSPVVPEYYEAQMAWKLQQLLKAQLEQRGITVTTTRTDPNKDLALEARGKKAKSADLFLSLHSNAAATDTPDWVVGICHTQDKYSDLDERSRQIATALSEAVAKIMGVKYQILSKESSKDRNGDGQKDDYYGVLRGCHSVGTPGVILEHGFHTHAPTAHWLLKEENLEKLACEEARIIAQWLVPTEKRIEIQLPVLKKGAKVDTVRALQALLVGYGSDIAVDGSFGPATDKAVRSYQKNHDLEVDGSVGRATWSHLLKR